MHRIFLIRKVAEHHYFFGPQNEHFSGFGHPKYVASPQSRDGSVVSLHWLNAPCSALYKLSKLSGCAYSIHSTRYTPYIMHIVKLQIYFHFFIQNFPKSNDVFISVFLAV